jgi:hypothetical protein
VQNKITCLCYALTLRQYVCSRHCVRHAGCIRNCSLFVTKNRCSYGLDDLGFESWQGKRLISETSGQAVSPPSPQPSVSYVPWFYPGCGVVRLTSYLYIWNYVSGPPDAPRGMERDNFDRHCVEYLTGCYSLVGRYQRFGRTHCLLYQYSAPSFVGVVSSETLPSKCVSHQQLLF